MRLLSKDLTTFEKSVLMAIGAAFGLFRGLRALGGVTGKSSELAVVKARMDAINLAVARLGDQAEQFHARLDRSVTREELSKTLDRVFGKLETEVDARFEHQTRSVEALRVMMAQTDELLQKVLDGLESIRNNPDLAESRQ
ncbi:MAG: hypothetical protein ABSG41_03790 [Bryobacteraceae bacterium]